jgi:hypothetical protein
LLVWAAPLLGLVAAGRSASLYMGFPPRTATLVHAPFDWAVFIVLSLPFLAALGLYAAAMARAPRRAHAPSIVGRFPWWGWLGLLLIALAWSVSWTEGLIEPAWRRHTFTPLWLGYILAANGLVHRRTGRSLLTGRTA